MAQSTTDTIRQEDELRAGTTRRRASLPSPAATVAPNAARPFPVSVLILGFGELWAFRVDLLGEASRKIGLWLLVGGLLRVRPKRPEPARSPLYVPTLPFDPSALVTAGARR